ncbi:hypothetical protein N234_08940 [Ralstonia pickettii DTP0602]|nr:hypothetical protein N234_08940 [Ralstonia pickettii DTP0602]
MSPGPQWGETFAGAAGDWQRRQSAVTQRAAPDPQRGVRLCSRASAGQRAGMGGASRGAGQFLGTLDAPHRWFAHDLPAGGDLRIVRDNFGHTLAIDDETAILTARRMHATKPCRRGIILRETMVASIAGSKGFMFGN